MSALLDVVIPVTCSHGGLATPVAGNVRVLVDGKPTVVLSTDYTIAGCPYVHSSGSASPCASGMWTAGSVRVQSQGQPLAVQGGQSICSPNGTPLVATGSGFRVFAS